MKEPGYGCARPDELLPGRGRRRRSAGRPRRGDQPCRGHLDPRVVPALVDVRLQRAPGLVIHLDYPLVRGRRRGEMAPAIRLERGAERDGEAVDLEAALLEEAGGPDGGGGGSPCRG